MNAKGQVRQILERLPDDVSLEEIAGRINAQLPSQAQHELEAIAQAGHKLAAQVLPREDFSDWENNPH